MDLLTKNFLPACQVKSKGSAHRAIGRNNKSISAGMLVFACLGMIAMFKAGILSENGGECTRQNSAIFFPPLTDSSAMSLTNRDFLFWQKYSNKCLQIFALQVRPNGAKQRFKNNNRANKLRTALTASAEVRRDLIAHHLLQFRCEKFRELINPSLIAKLPIIYSESLDAQSGEHSHGGELASLADSILAAGDPAEILPVHEDGDNSMRAASVETVIAAEMEYARGVGSTEQHGRTGEICDESKAGHGPSQSDIAANILTDDNRGAGKVVTRDAAISSLGFDGQHVLANNGSTGCTTAVANDSANLNSTKQFSGRERHGTGQPDGSVSTAAIHEETPAATRIEMHHSANFTKVPAVGRETSGVALRQIAQPVKGHSPGSGDPDPSRWGRNRSCANVPAGEPTKPMDANVNSSMGPDDVYNVVIRQLGDKDKCDASTDIDDDNSTPDKPRTQKTERGSFTHGHGWKRGGGDDVTNASVDYSAMFWQIPLDTERQEANNFANDRAPTGSDDQRTEDRQATRSSNRLELTDAELRMLKRLQEKERAIKAMRKLWRAQPPPTQQQPLTPRQLRQSIEQQLKWPTGLCYSSHEERALEFSQQWDAIIKGHVMDGTDQMRDTVIQAIGKIRPPQLQTWVCNAAASGELSGANPAKQ